MATENQEANEIRQFLLNIGVEDAVAKKFEEEKMTYETILQASEEQLMKDLSLAKLGDRLSLRAFCEDRKNLKASKKQATAEAEGNDARKRCLIQQLQNRRKMKVHSKESNSTGTGKGVSTAGNTKTTRKVELAWLHEEKNEKMKLVRLKNGSGTRNVNIEKSATEEEVIDIASKLFFSDGSSIFGPVEQMELNLLSFNKESISVLKLDGKEVPFNLQSYIDIFKCSRIRLSLHTKTKEESDGQIDDSGDTDSDQDTIVDISMHQESHSINERFQIQNQDGLIGSSSERQELRDLIDRAYEESLRVDEAKANADVNVEQTSNRQKENNVNNLENLKKIRSQRLPKEPCAAEPHYIVSVRHLTLGILTRMLLLDDFVYSIYDWIGSFPESPEYFQLCNYSGDYLSPSASVRVADKCMLVMVQSEEPVPFSPNDQEVSLRGFGSVCGNQLPGGANETVLDPIEEHCPCVILQDDSEEEFDVNPENDPYDMWRTVEKIDQPMGLKSKRNVAFHSLEMIPDIVLERSNIVQSLLNIYQSNDLSNKIMNIILKNELAQDLDGVKREVYSIFWEEVTCRYFEGGNSFVPRVGPDITDDLCMVFGRAIIHCFLITGILPIQISKPFMVAVMVGEEPLSDQDILDGFLEYVLDYEAAVLRNALQEAENGGLKAETQQEVLEILAPYGIRALPTASTMKSVLIGTARCELLQKVSRSIGKVREGILEMGSQIVEGSSKEEVLELYTDLIPTPAKLLARIRPDVDGELTKMQEEVLQHLRKYINAANPETLKRLLRFITGSNYLVASEIKVIFHLSIGRIPCFTVHTCSCTVDLPVGGYLGFTDFKYQLNSILNNSESWKFHLV